MKRLKFLPLIIVVALSLIFLAGAKKEEKVAPPEEEAVVEEVEEVKEVVPGFPTTISGNISCMTYWTGGVEAEGFELVAKKFAEDYPNIKLTIVPVGNPEIHATLPANLSSTRPVESFLFWPVHRLQPYVDQGLVAPLTKIFEETDYDKLAPGVRSWTRYAGHGDTPYSIPMNIFAYAIFYNVHKFKEARIEKTPITWDEFLDVCDKLLDAGIYPTARSAGKAGSPHWAWMDKFMQRTIANEPEYTAGLRQLKGSFDTPEFRKAVSYWDDMLPYWHPDSPSLTYGDIYMMLARGDIAMQCIGSWIIGSYEKEMGLVPFEDYDMFPFPIIDPDIPLRETGTCNTIQLAMSAKDNKAAQAWVAYWALPQTQKIFCDHTSNMPAIESVPASSPMLKKIASELKGREFRHFFGTSPGIEIPIVQELEKRSYGITTTDEFIKSLERLLAEERERQKKE